MRLPSCHEEVAATSVRPLRKLCVEARLTDPAKFTFLKQALAVAGAAAACAILGSSALAHDTDMASEAHAHHHHHMAPETTRSITDYTIPQVQLVQTDGKSVALSTALDDGRPVLLNFIYTSCTTVCPISSQTFSDLQGKLGALRDKVHLVSISIDPEQDTPARLRDYAARFSAGPEWQFFTGTLAASTAAQRAFNVYRGDKMDHAPVTLVRLAPGAQWVRIEGFATADDLLKEVRQAVASR